MRAIIRYFFISLHYVINSNAKIDEKNNISKYMWIYLNIFNISAYCTVSKIGTLANGLQIKNRVSIINCGSDSYIKKLHIWEACIPLKGIVGSNPPLSAKITENQTFPHYYNLSD